MSGCEKMILKALGRENVGSEVEVEGAGEVAILFLIADPLATTHDHLLLETTIVEAIPDPLHLDDATPLPHGITTAALRHAGI